MAYKSATVYGPVDLKSKELSEQVKKAKQEKKIFMVIGGYELIKTSLLLRGWLEKIPEDRMPYIGTQAEKMSIALLLKNCHFNFIWQPRLRPIKINENMKPYVNSVIRNGALNFTNKDGIVHCMNNFHWNYIEGLTDLNIQRTHILSDRSSKEEFFEDYRRTAFTSFILYLDSFNDISHLFYPNGDISCDCIKFAIQKIELLLKMANHEDIDTTNIFDICAKYPKDQKKTLTETKLIVSGVKKFRAIDEDAMLKLAADIHACAEKILKQWPYTKYDGFRNIWIFKPVGSSSGYGIQVTNKENEMKEITIGKNGATVRYVAQKYIERPLIIHKRKFDMRLYLLTMIKEKHIDIWLYKDCYVKFATSPFNVNFFHKSIHVTNYAVQKYFMNEKDAVPDARENMWTLQQLIEYFETTGKPRLWQSHIYPAIKKNLLAVIIPSFEHTELQENNFELNGIDVMITFDYEPILIEINSVPALYFSQTVQEIMTKKLLEDVIKVVVDHSRDSSAYTGDFECIHSEPISWCDNTQNLIISGTSIHRGTTYRRSAIQYSVKTPINVRQNTKTINKYSDFNDRYVYLKSV
ncbi:hypothetical protein PVAND_011111 [Polypedilum vanderplanki]|uniref:Uncharacterized protein n=1 Tax=Polypedilum vanderplanki TaxID=319348 RepID=A0A9J6CIB7_POLVA|nr:hypothetical protein PVAND_011111 [Polypedilum vanderplanki]